MWRSPISGNGQPDAASVPRERVRVGIALPEAAVSAQWRDALRGQGFALAQSLAGLEDPAAVLDPADWDALIAGAASEPLLLRLAALGADRPVCFVLVENDDLVLIEKCFALGADDVFSVRLSPEILASRLLKHLRDRRAMALLSEGTVRAQRLFLNVVKVMVKVLETKDEYTKFHSDNVARYSRMIAVRLGLSAQEVYNAGLAGLLHDFGKIGVSEKILNKPSRLTEQEFAVIKRHPSIGSLILESIAGLEDVIPGIKYHHERWDGRGYPDGLQGEEIPVLGRIVGLADAYDTLTSDRTYHRRLPQEEAVAEIRRCAGTQFDPKVVEAFLASLQSSKAG